MRWRALGFLAVAACGDGLTRPVVTVDVEELSWRVPEAGAPRTVRVGNGGEVPLGVASYVVTGADPDAFDVTAALEPAEGLIGAVAPGGEGALEVGFTATHEGAHDAVLQVVFGEGDAALDADARPTVDRRRGTAYVWLHGEAAGRAPSRGPLGFRVDATGGAPGEEARLQILGDAASDASWEEIGEGDVPTFAYTWVWVGPDVDEPRNEQVSFVIVGVDGFQQWGFVDLTAGPLAWFDERVRP